MARSAQQLGEDYVFIAFQGTNYPGKDRWQSLMQLRNEILSLYFRTRVVSMTKEDINYTGKSDTEIRNAHDWYHGIQQAVIRAPSEVESEIRAAANYISRRPSTATVRARR